MKQIIVLTAMVALGISIFKLIAGDGDDSIMHTMKDVWEEEIAMRTSFP